MVIDLGDLAVVHGTPDSNRHQVTIFVAGLVVFRTGRLSGAAPLHVFGDAMNVQEDQARAAGILCSVSCDMGLAVLPGSFLQVDKWLQSKLLGGSATLTAGSQSDEVS